MNIDIKKLEEEIDKASEDVSKEYKNVGFCTDNPVTRGAAVGKHGALISLRSCLIDYKEG